MGADIVLWLEAEHPSVGGWVPVAEFAVGRYYGLFGAWAGVRGQPVRGTPEPRGLPDDVSQSVSRGYHDTIPESDRGLSCASWLTPSEWWTLTDLALLAGEADDIDDQPWYIALAGVLDSGMLSYRLVFWFKQ